MEFKQHIMEAELLYSLNMTGCISPQCFQHLQISLVLWKTEVNVLQNRHQRGAAKTLRWHSCSASKAGQKAFSESKRSEEALHSYMHSPLFC